MQSSRTAIPKNLNYQLDPGSTLRKIWGFPKIRGAILGVPIIRIIVFLGSILGSKLPYLQKPMLEVCRLLEAVQGACA